MALSLMHRSNNELLAMTFRYARIEQRKALLSKFSRKNKGALLFELLFLSTVFVMVLVISRR